MIKAIKSSTKIKHRGKIEWGMTNMENFQTVFDVTPPFRIIGSCSINLHLSITNRDERLYIITDQKKLYISVTVMPKQFWYPFTKNSFIKYFDELYESFNIGEYNLEFKKDYRGFMGKGILSDMVEIENHLLISPYTELLVWGSRWGDHPFRNTYLSNPVGITEHSIFHCQSMLQDGKSIRINVRTEFSKSIISVELFDGLLFINIKYNPTGFKHEFGNHPDDIPIDVIATIDSFPFATHIDVLGTEKLTLTNFTIATLISDGVETDQEIIDHIKKMDQEMEQTVLDAIEKFKHIHKMDLILMNKKILHSLDGDKTIEEILEIINGEFPNYKDDIQLQTHIQQTIIDIIS